MACLVTKLTRVPFEVGYMKLEYAQNVNIVCVLGGERGHGQCVALISHSGLDNSKFAFMSYESSFYHLGERFLKWF